MENFKNEKDKALWSAAYDGDAAGVTKALKNGADVNCVNYLNMTPLTALLDASDSLNPRTQMKIAKILVDAGADVNVISELGANPVSLAIENGRFTILKFLHENGADITLRTSSGDNFIYKAVDAYDGSKNYLNIIDYLTENGVDADAEMYENKQTALFRATDLQHLSIVKLLVNKGKADVNKKDAWGLSPLHYAARRESYNIVKFLVDSGADVNAQDEYGFTPLHEAVLSDNGHIVFYLVDKAEADKTLGLKADFEEFSKGDTPYDVAVKTSKSSTMKNDLSFD